MILENCAVPIEDRTLKNPFPGLRPFESTESDLFFGRDGQCDEMLIRLSKTHFLAVVGRSGSGKSSLVRAGLLASLYGGLMGKAGSGWHIAVLRPGSDPIGHLTRALNEPGVLELEDDESRDIQTEVDLRRGSRGLVEIVHQARLTRHENLLVVVDQFEEIFRYDRISEDEKYANDADAFVKLLLEARRESNIYVVLTMRSEYLGECARFWDLPEAINEGEYLIPRMTRENCRKAITGPIEMLGAKISPGLVNQLLNDMALVDTQYQLPVLQHAMMRIWEKWRGRGDESAELDFSHYEMIGGLSKTLDRHAEEAFAELPNENRTIAEKLFKCLTEKDADGHETRRPTKLSEIRLITGARKKELIDVIEIFRREDRSFLMPSRNVRLKSDTSIDISHESLINGWQQLSIWVEDQANSVRIYRQLAENALIYPEEALAKSRLQDALDLRDKKKPNRVWARRYHARFYRLLEPSVRGKARDKRIFNLAIDFLNRSERVRDESKKAEERQHRRQVRRAWQFAVAGAVATAVILMVLVWTLRVLDQRDGAIRTIRAMNLLNYRTTMMLARQASQDGKWGETNQFLARLPLPGVEDLRGLDWYYLWGASHDEQETLRAHAAEISSVAFSPDGQTIATGSEDETVILWDARSRRMLRELKGHRAAILSVAFAADGKTLASGSADGTVKLWKTSTGEEKNNLPSISKDSVVLSVAFASNSNKLAIGSSDGSVRIWDINTLQVIYAPIKHKEYVSSVSFYPDGTTIVSGSADGTVRLWDANTGQDIDELKAKELDRLALDEDARKILSVAVSPDGGTIAVATREGFIQLWSANSRQEKGTLTPRALAAVLCLSFADNYTLISGNDDATIKTWNLTTGMESRTLKGHSKPVSAIAVSPDWKTVATGSADTTAKLWDLSAPVETIKPAPTVQRVLSVAFSPSIKNRIIAIGSGDGTIKLLDLDTQQERTLPGHSPSSVLAVAFSFDGQQIASGGADNTVKLWNVATGQLITTLLGHTGEVSAVAFSVNGRSLASGSWDKTVRLWDLNTQDSRTFTQLGIVQAVAFSPDGKTIAAGGDDGSIKVWDAQNNEEPGQSINPAGGRVLTLAFSSDGKFLASGSTDGAARLWDAKSGKALTTLTGHNDAVVCVAFSPDDKNQRLVTASKDGSVKFWDTNMDPREPARREELVTLMSDFGDGKTIVSLSSLAFSPDGQMLATGRDDGSIEFWRAASTDQEAKQR